MAEKRKEDTSSKINRLIKRYASAKSRSDVWQSIWDNAYSLIFPQRNLYRRLTPGSPKSIFVFDGTAQIAANRFISQVHNGLTPLFSQWAELVPGDEVPDALKADIARSLQKTTDIVFKYLDSSNFNLVVNEAYHDLVIGTAAMLCLEGETDDEPFIFRYVPLQDLSLEETQQSDIKNVWRTFLKVPVIDIRGFWPKAKMSEELKRMAEKDTTSCINIIEGTLFDEKTKDYTYYVIDLSHKKILWEVTEKSSPWIIFRWDKTRGEVFGRGPGIKALPTINTLNLMAEFTLAAAELTAYPIYTAWDDSVFNPWTAKIRPKSIIPVAPNPGGSASPIQPLPQAGQVQFAQLVMQDLRDQINKMFFTDPIGPVDQNPQMTATEINLRNQQNLEEKAPSIGRIQVEFTEKLIKRMIFILRKKGLIPNIEVNNKEISINYRSDLGKLDDVRNVNNLVQSAQMLQQIIGPQLTVGAFKLAQLPEYIAENMGVDLDLINSPAEIQAAQQQAQEQAQQQAPQLPGAPVGGQQQPPPQQQGA